MLGFSQIITHGDIMKVSQLRIHGTFDHTTHTFTYRLGNVFQGCEIHGTFDMESTGKNTHTHGKLRVQKICPECNGAAVASYEPLQSSAFIRELSRVIDPAPLETQSVPLLVSGEFQITTHPNQTQKTPAAPYTPIFIVQFVPSEVILLANELEYNWSNHGHGFPAIC